MQVPSGASAFLGPGTPPGAKYGSSAGNPYLVLRARADTPTGRSTTTYTFDAPTPDTGWGFVLGDLDADLVAVSATDASGAAVAAAEIDSWFAGTFNYAGGTDQPTWDAATSTLTGNAAALDTDGAAGWFEPDIRLTSLTMTFTRRSGFPVYQTWFVSRARPIGGTVEDVSTVGTCAPGGLTLSLVSPFGDTLATTTPAADGSYSFGELATQAGYTVRADVPDGCVVIGPAEQTVSNRGNDNDPASRADFDVRAIVPQPISGTVRDDDGAPVAGVTVTLAGPGGPATTTTAADGSYLFDNNPIGTGYTVTIAVPAGYTAGPGGTQIGGIAVTNVPVPGQDFTVVDLPAVSGTVTGAGSGLGGVQVVLTPDGGGTPSTTVTTGDGSYEVDGLPPGDYTLEVIPPDGWTAPGPQDITVPADGLTGQDIALTSPGALGGAVTTDGAPSAGVTVAVDGPGGPLTLQTDADGQYFLDDLPPGSYTITITVPGGTTATGPTTRTVTITAAGEVRGGQDFTLTTARAQPNRATTAQDVTVTVDVVGNDTPGTGQTFDLTSVVFTSPNATNGGRTLTAPGEGVYTIDPVTGAVTFDPEPGFSGQATPVGYQVSDTNGSTVRSTVTITVTPAVPPVPPVSPVPPGPPVPPVPDDDDVDLVLDKRAVSGTQARVGGTVRYKLTVRNKGTDAASRAVTLVDRLPAGLELVAARSNGWACTARKAADTVRCVLRKDIGAGRKAAPVFVVTQPTKAATGRLSNVARVRVAGESVRTNNTATAVVTVVPAQLPATGFRLLTWP
ncbi:carboxypeptidase regulatory-like domain-containing protein [Nocardioides sp. P5_E3]